MVYNSLPRFFRILPVFFPAGDGGRSLTEQRTEGYQHTRSPKARARRAGLWDQATKRSRRMPRRLQAMKDAAVCDKPRGADNRPRSGDFRMGKPVRFGGHHAPNT